MQENFIGQSFNRLRIIKFVEKRNGQSFYQCMCECGVIKILNIHPVKKGFTKSCGCIRRDTHWKRIPIEYNGQVTPLNDLCRELEVPMTKLYGKIKSGLTFEQAYTEIKSTIQGRNYANHNG